MAADKEKLDFDVIIVGAGISGINFAYRLQERNPELKYCILEGRHEIGGTWSLFQYPGIRSDSDLFTFGFAWRPWVGNMSIVHGSIIRQYVEDSATQEGIDKKIRFLHQVSSMSWSSLSNTWTLSITSNTTTNIFLRSRFVFLGTGYYDYQKPLQASIPGIDSFKGKVIHPQFWPSDLDYANKRIVIIGSGATAITLLPSLATNSAHVTMLQRSPTYIASLPREGKFEAIISRALPMFASSRIIRLKWILFSLFMVSICRHFPRTAKRLLLQRTAKLLPPGTNLEPDFVPSYNPWEQRLCLCPDGDFYSSIRSGKASVKTSKIEAITPHSIKLTSGEELNPDIIVTATGLKLCTAGNIAISVDGEEYDISHHFAWRAAMVEGLPNVVLSWGYSNASWTLGADSTAQLACRLLTRMKKEGFLVIVPRMTPEDRETLKERPFLALSATYVKIGGDAFPKTASTDPWRPRSYFWKDLAVARWGDIETGMEWLR
ncbi:putative flavoprotein [Talaromyces proteolyticus]|uniref:Flavoprotein n=1 Tax=Talaromyces proteolyticus TaxID=1131652 RepID=A0AAD4KY47_9EURO|nr:putative flavoprotein [Talaromyces proteolyticus]KAH8698661.1 putative flavoprotein [Talaromyces proteolyticus]